MYTIAGMVEERVTGESWETLVEREIFKPLGMTHSSSNGGLRTHNDYALPHDINSANEMAVTSPVIQLDAVAPAGAIVSSIEDLSRYALFHLGNGSPSGRAPILSAGSFEKIHTPAIELSPFFQQFMVSTFSTEGKGSYQLGWFEYKRHGLKIVQHGGGIRGFVSDFLMVPEKGVAVLLLSNYHGVPVTYLAHDILDHLLGKESKGFAKEVQVLIGKTLAEQAERSKSKPALKVDARIPGDYIHKGDIFPFSIVAVKGGLEFVCKELRAPFIQREEDFWGIETPDQIYQGFNFKWDSKRIGWLINFAGEQEAAAFFEKKTVPISSL